MSNLPDIHFVEYDAEQIVNQMVASWEATMGETLKPGSRDYVQIMWIANIIIQIMADIDISARKNVARYADGEYLDYLTDLFSGIQRLPATPAAVTMQFTISEAQPDDTTIPEGTRITTADEAAVFATVADCVIQAGQLTGQVQAVCQTAGTSGNGYVPGQITRLVDVVRWYDHCSNTTTSAGGTDVESDENLYTRMRASMDAYSTAGPSGAYAYYAKTVSSDIVDVRVIRPCRTVTKKAKVYASHVFVGGDIVPGSVSVGNASSSDYTVTSDGELTTISLSGSLATASEVDISYDVTGAGQVEIYPLMRGGVPLDEETAGRIQSLCDASTVRPLTDTVSVKSPETVNYNIALTYYLNRAGSPSATEMAAKVRDSVNDYIKWQQSQLGRDVNPSQLIYRVMQTGVKRVDVVSPVLTPLSDGTNGHAPQLAVVGEISLVNGGYEDD